MVGVWFQKPVQHVPVALGGPAVPTTGHRLPCAMGVHDQHLHPRKGPYIMPGWGLCLLAYPGLGEFFYNLLYKIR